MAFEIGQTTGGYEFLDLLDRSRRGLTYKVRNVLAQRLEVLKVLPKVLQEDQDRVERFLREIKVHARLSHPHIVTFYNAAQIDGELVMTTELVEGLSLADYLGSGPIAEAEAVSYISQVLSALGFAHQQGIVHREVTPANITVTPERTVKLGGFSLAKAVTDAQLTQVGAMVGSLEYMSPEQVKGAASLDARTDLYSAGVLLYQLTTGQLPFESKSQFELMLAHVNSAPRPPAEINPSLSPQLGQIILKALAKDPAQRYQTAEEFRQALKMVQPAAAPVRAQAPPKHEELRPQHVLPPLARPAAAAPSAVAVADDPELPVEGGAGVLRAQELTRSGWRSPEGIAIALFAVVILLLTIFILITVNKK